ncbi:hypothetical protein PHMEG_00027037 [Phytophthora megakarya]|uniref:Bzip transcription factor n=1 Tax=Phytophthora megakarya TaxID=4795 RepID=A0A225V997_9STRA|nr:hypothetical protein PHMEG_00027037 [Phytophthora megakarya]
MKALIKAEIILDRRRQQSRVNMARHRKKMQDGVDKTEKDVHQLRDEIHKLEVQRELLRYIVSTQTTPWNVVAEYFRLFQLAFTKTNDPSSPYDIDVHRAFLRATMTPDVAVEYGIGPEVILEHFQRLSMYHPKLNVQLVHLDSASDDLVLATTRTDFAFTISTVENAFPHLLNDPELWTRIGSKLVGKQLVVRGFAYFGWDKVTSRVTSIHYKADMLTPMLKLLGNLNDVSRVFEHAGYRPDCTMVRR